MTPENHPPTPEAKAKKLYVAAAKEVINEAAKNAPETTARYEVVDAYLDGVLQDADAEKITGSAGVYTRELLLKQLDYFLDEVHQAEDQREVADPYLLIPGKDGLRSSFRALMGDETTRRDLEMSLRIHIDAESEKSRAELLSPENIEDMGKAELTAAEVEEPLAESRRAAAAIIDGIPNEVMYPALPAIDVPKPVFEPPLDVSSEPLNNEASSGEHGKEKVSEAEARRMLRALDDIEAQLQYGERIVIDETSQTLEDFMRAINREDYMSGAIQTLIERAADQLIYHKSRIKRLNEETTDDAQVVTPQDAFGPELSDGVDAFRRAIKDQSEVLDTLADEKIYQAVNHMDSVLQNTKRSGGVRQQDIDELTALARGLRSELQSDALHDSLATAKRLYVEVSERLRAILK